MVGLTGIDLGFGLNYCSQMRILYSTEFREPVLT